MDFCDYYARFMLISLLALGVNLFVLWQNLKAIRSLKDMRR